MPNQVPSPEEPKPIEHYIGAAVVTALGGIQSMAPIIEALHPEAQNAFIMDIAQRTAKIAGETIRAHHADGKVDI
ncbi:hypothetical protein SEA_ALBRIGHT_58 [Microbacterium phage Albright]|uniref:hypothetical protein n=1 Tax=Microbacterium phage Albright TaxID=2816467 RepID=UPI001BB52873|nr:hypothetical protein QDW28_gp58 [Microbacterium phage Albright]QTF82233.1 hypothetical protein SEA_ALBRIGHT_58 [Microbacterium phage Albright]